MTAVDEVGGAGVVGVAIRLLYGQENQKYSLYLDDMNIRKHKRVLCQPD